MPTDIQPPRGVHILELHGYEDIYKLWDRFRAIKIIFDDYTREDFERFVRLLMNPATLWLETDDGNGILYLTEITPGLSAAAHFAFWDGKLSGREGLLIECMKWAVIVLNLVKINVWIPEFAKAAVHFSEKIGFKREGVLRRWSYSNGALYDVIALGITREEVLNGSVYDAERSRAKGKLGGSSDELNEPGLPEGSRGPDATAEDESGDLYTPANPDPEPEPAGAGVS